MRLSDFCALSQEVPSPAPLVPVSKWLILRELSKSRQVFDLGERALSVLQALLSFHPEDDLIPGKALIVFPSNKAICERLHGMACSTMRRHLAALIRSGFLRRQDSPNGKRYARPTVGETVAFGFDLSPLLARWSEITDAAQAVRREEAEARDLREAISLMRRDLLAALTCAENIEEDVTDWGEVSDVLMLTARALKRRNDLAALNAIREQVVSAMELARRLLLEMADMSTSESRNEQHLQNSDKDLNCSEEAVAAPSITREKFNGDSVPEKPEALVYPLHVILAACPQIKSFSNDEIRCYRDLVDVASHLAPALGLSSEVWANAQRALGREQAAIVLAAMLERFDVIRSPGAYLRVLVRKAVLGQFTSGPMIAALLRS